MSRIWVRTRQCGCIDLACRFHDRVCPNEHTPAAKWLWKSEQAQEEDVEVLEENFTLTPNEAHTISQSTQVQSLITSLPFTQV